MKHLSGKVRFLAGALLAVALLMAGCTSRNPVRANVPATTSPTATVPATSIPAGNASADDPASGSATSPRPTDEPTLGAERIIVPPLAPGEVVRKEPRPNRPPSPTPSAEPMKSPRRPQAGPATRTPDVDPPAEPEPARTEARPPALKPMMTDSERRQLGQQAQGNLERARRNLANLQESRLPDTERTVLQEARSFVARAEQLLQSDLALANSLAERAAILTQELLRKQR